MHSDEASTEVYLPTLQLEQLAVPATGANMPVPHGKQPEPPGLAQKYPGLQSLQDVLPLLSANCPAAHNAQVSVPALLAKEPKPQAKHVELPNEECFPAAHAVHIVWDTKGATSPASQ
jgi:hypothetical protein